VTRAELKAFSADLWQQNLGSVSWGDPIGVNQALSSVADALAIRKKIWHGFRVVDLVAGQGAYSLSNTFDLRAVSVKSGAGRFTLLDLYSVVRVQREGRQYDGLPVGFPSFAIDAGQTLFVAAPPASSVPGGLELLGFHNPGTFQNCLWPDDLDECPLPVWSHETIGLGLAANRAGVYAAGLKDRQDRQEARAVARELQAQYESSARRCEAEAHREYARVNGLRNLGAV
jgi:hypothetical protein